MKKLFKWLLIIIPVVIVVGVIALFLSLNSLIKAGVETVGPKIIKAPVTVRKVSLSPFSGTGEINGLIVGNPEGFKSKSAFELGTVKVDIDLGSLKSDTIVINEITIDAPNITYERALKTSNIKQILDNVEAFSGGKGGTPKEPEEKPTEAKSEKPAKKVVIKKIAITNASARVTASLLGDTVPAIKIPNIIMTDIGTEKEGVSSAEAVKKILSKVLTSVRDAYKNIGGLDALKNAGKSLEGGTDALKDTGKALEDGANDAVKGLKGLFKKD